MTSGKLALDDCKAGVVTFARILDGIANQMNLFIERADNGDRFWHGSPYLSVLSLP